MEDIISQEDELIKSKYSFTPEEKRLKRFLELIPGIISWSMILFPIIISPFNPYIAGYYILIFDVYWFTKSVRLGLGSVISYRRILKSQKENWVKRMQDENMDYESIIHTVLIAEAKEPIGVLRRNLERLKTQQLDSKKQLIVVLASERIDPDAETKFQELYNEYKDSFKDFIQTMHVLVAGEVKGKHSNLRHAAIEVDKYLIENKYNFENITITSSDADSQLPPDYFAQLTYQVLKDPDRRFHFYHAAMIYLANAMEIPFPNRVFAAGSSLNNISHLIYDDLIPVSTYSGMFSTFKEAGFWSVDVIPEDFHMFFKTFFKLGEKVKTIPIYSIIYAEAAWGETFLKGIRANYVQMVRWAWGVSDDPYIIKSFFKSKIPFMTKLRKVFRPLEEHFLWPTNWFLITIGTNIPFWFNENFKNTSFSTGMVQVTQTLVTLALVFIVSMIFIQIKLTPPHPRNRTILGKSLRVLEWVSLPVTSFFFSMLPGLEAHTRLMFGKYLSYVVTEKKD